MGFFLGLDLTGVTVTVSGSIPLKLGLADPVAVPTGPGFLLIAIGDALVDEDGPGFRLMAIGDAWGPLGAFLVRGEPSCPLAMAVMGLFFTEVTVALGAVLPGPDLEAAVNTGVRATRFFWTPPGLEQELSWPLFSISVSCLVNLASGELFTCS